MKPYYDGVALLDGWGRRPSRAAWIEGLNETTIAKYIREQEAHDIALDKLGVKEHEGPFKGK